MPDAPQRRRRGRGLPTEEMHERYPSLTALARPAGKGARGAWIAAFNARPDAMAALLGDFIKQVHAQPGRIGQRPMPREEEVDFQSLVYGEENDLPLVEVLPKLIPCSINEFADRLGIMSRGQLRRILAGTYEPNVYELRAIAKAVRKSPLFFLEYRKAMVVSAVINLLDERPGVATMLYRRYLEVRMG